MPVKNGTEEIAGGDVSILLCFLAAISSVPSPLKAGRHSLMPEEWTNSQKRSCSHGERILHLSPLLVDCCSWDSRIPLRDGDRHGRSTDTERRPRATTA